MHKKMKHLLHYLAFITGLFIWSGSLQAQYFGQNKPRYKSIEFNVLETPHFSIHYYTKNKEALNLLADWSEQWYDMHSDIFGDTIALRNPIIFYNNHAEFQQTNAISGEIGVGT